MGVVHELLMSHDRVRRTVTNLPNGIRTVTESDDPRVAASIREHVSSMDERLRDGDLFNVASPNLPILFRNKDLIRTEIRQTPTGVELVQTSDDPATVAALQAHAAEVSELVREGMAAMMRAMHGTGGMMHPEGGRPR
jgi:hypothetical protein